jgi:kinesin family protein 5
VIVREQQDRSKQVGEENELLLRRRDELEQRLATLEQEYEELLGEISSLSCCELDLKLTSVSGMVDKTLARDEQEDAEKVHDIKGKLEAQYAMKLESALGDVNDLRNQLELKSNEVKSSSATVEELRAANAELEVRLSFPFSALTLASR